MPYWAWARIGVQEGVEAMSTLAAPPWGDGCGAGQKEQGGRRRLRVAVQVPQKRGSIHDAGADYHGSSTE
jgi:hypothetical protein